MADIWTILEITLSASLTAGLLLAVKALFRDKLDARWHYLVWCCRMKSGKHKISFFRSWMNRAGII